MEDEGVERLEPQTRMVAAAIICIPAVAIWLGFGERFRVPKMLVGEWLAVTGLVLIAVRGGCARRWADVAWDLPVIAAVVSMLAMDEHGLTGWRDIARLAALSAAFTLIRSVGDPWRLASVVMLATVINAGLALLQWAGLGLWASDRTGRHAVYATFGNPNLLGEWMAVAIPLIAVAAAQARQGLLRAVSWWVAGLALVALLATGARAAALGLAMASPVLALALGPWEAGAGAVRARVRILLVTGTALALAAAVFVFRSPDPASLRPSAADPTRATRALMRGVAADQWASARWLGIGPGQFGLQFLDGAAKRLESATAPPIYPGITMEAHADPAQALAERGALGALAWCVALGAALGLTRARGSIADPVRRSRFLGAVAAAIAMAVTACLGFPFHVFPTAVLFLWIIAVAADAGSTPPAAHDDPLLAVWSRVRALAFLVLIPLAGRDALAQAALAANTEPALRAALRALPTDGDLRFRLALGLRSVGRTADAEPEFKAALPGHPDPDVRFNLGKIALDRREYPAAVLHFGDGLRRYPYFSAPAWADYALALAGTGRTSEARAAAERALAIEPGIARARTLLSELGRPRSAGPRR